MGFPPTPTGAVGGALAGTLPNPTFSIPGTFGSGDNFGVLIAGVTPADGKFSLGTSASPDGGLKPVIKATRVLSMANTVPSGDGSEQLATINGVAWGTSTNQVQPVGVFGGAKNDGTTDPGGTGCHPDAVGVYGVGDIRTGGIGSGIGMVAVGRKDAGATAAARARGIEVASYNATGTNDTWPASWSGVTFKNVLSSGVHVDSQGLANGNSAVALAVNHSSGTGLQFDVGLGFTGENNGGTIGPVASTSIQDDSNSVTSIKVKGSHTTGIDLSSGTFSAAGIAMGTNTITGLSASDYPVQGFTTGILVPTFYGAATVIPTASRAYLTRFLCLKTQTITKMSFVTTIAATNNDNCDVGIFSGDGLTLLGSAGSTAGKLNATVGVQTVNLTGSVNLVAGTVYYAAFAYGTVGGTAATLAISSLSVNGGDIMGATLPNRMQSFQAAAFPLAAPHTTGGSLAGTPVLGLLL